MPISVLRAAARIVQTATQNGSPVARQIRHVRQDKHISLCDAEATARALPDCRNQQAKACAPLECDTIDRRQPMNHTSLKSMLDQVERLSEHLWIPQWMERRRIGSRKLQKMTGWLRKPARWMDRITKQRCSWLINHAGAGIVAISCIIIAAATPVLEFVPFSANLAGLAITTFALALIARDGLVAAIAILLAIGTAGLVAYSLSR
jgi:hypothetical protein